MWAWLSGWRVYLVAYKTRATSDPALGELLAHLHLNGNYLAACAQPWYDGKAFPSRPGPHHNFLSVRHQQGGGDGLYNIPLASVTIFLRVDSELSEIRYVYIVMFAIHMVIPPTLLKYFY